MSYSPGAHPANRTSLTNSAKSPAGLLHAGLFIGGPLIVGLVVY